MSHTAFVTDQWLADKLNAGGPTPPPLSAYMRVHDNAYWVLTK